MWIQYKPFGSILNKYWVFSVLYINDEKILYFGLTFFGVSVTIQKKKKSINDKDFDPYEKPEI